MGLVQGCGTAPSSAQVNVAGLVVSSTNISNCNFMHGNYTFDQPGDPNATISNAGAITAVNSTSTQIPSATHSIIANVEADQLGDIIRTG